MAGTVIDEFIISIGLDASKFDHAQKLMLANLRNFEKDTVSTSSSVERASQKMLDGFSRLTREILGVGAAMLGVNGLKDLAVKTVDAAAGVERLATALDIDPVLANKWVNLMRVVAGQSPGTTINALGQLRRAVEEFLKTGKGPLLEAKPAMEAMGVQPPANIKDIDQWLLRIGAAAQQPQNKEFLSFLLTRIPGMSELGLGLREPNLARELDRLQNLTKQQAEAADHIKRVFTDIIVSLEGFINRLLPAADSVITKAIKGDAQGVMESIGVTGKGTEEKRRSLDERVRRFIFSPEGYEKRFGAGSENYTGMFNRTPLREPSLITGGNPNFVNPNMQGGREIPHVTINMTAPDSQNPRAFGRAAADAFYDAVGIQAQNGGH